MNPEVPVVAASPEPILALSILPVVNFALQQNHVPLIRELTLTNTSDQDWQDLSVSITSAPAFTLAWKQQAGQLAKGASCSLQQFPLQVQPQYLAELTERISGHLTITVMAGDTLIVEEHRNIDLLAYDQWSGTSLLPEMTAAFITPNHPEIPAIIRKAAAILASWTGNPSFDAYQSRNPNRVRQQMAALYEAIASLQLIYCAVPASFEESGQRVRLADTVLTQKLANCLDLSLLYAACLEAVGINPLVVIVKGHAFAGAWLIDESFADAVNDDPSLISKRTADGIGEMAVVECTCMNAGNNADFDTAARLAEERMQQTEDFNLFIDVKRARSGRILPLPLRIAGPAGWEFRNAQPVQRDSSQPEAIFIADKLAYAAKIEATKQRLWERKLLDLSLRNALLNVRITKGTVQFMTTNVGLLEDALANGDEFQVLSRPADWDNGLRDTGLYKMLHQSDPVAELVQQELLQKRIRTYLPEAELQNSLITIYRNARLALEENGANTLYVGIGMLRWYETEASERPRYAPLLLMPVEIIRKTTQKGFIIRSREEETIMNITLLEMLRQDFGINIGGLETLPRDESGVDVKRVFHVLRQAVMSRSRWDVEEQALLGTFSFSKFMLWNDIHHNADKLAKHKVVASLMSGKLEWQPELMHTDARGFDSSLQPDAIALPISTDSSQLQAIVSSGEGKSFVLHGPPGTGKSQTITNIIANAIYAGKRVLFVAAKKAALDVVEQRLQAIGLAPFCLELHSNKSKKSAVLEQLKAATEVAAAAAPESFAREAKRLFELRSELNTYVQALHRKQDFGYSLFELFTAYSQLPSGEDKVHFSFEAIAQLNPERLSQWEDLAQEMQAVALIAGNPQEHPLRELQAKQYTAGRRQDVLRLLNDYIPQLREAASQTQAICAALGLRNLGPGKEQAAALQQLSGLLRSLGDLPAAMLQGDAWEQRLQQVIELAAHGSRRDQLRTALLQGYQKTITAFPAAQALGEWNAAAGKWFLPRWLGQRAVLKKLKTFALAGTVGKEEVVPLLQSIMQLQEEQEILDKAIWLPAFLGFLWRDDGADWQKLADDCKLLIAMNRQAAQLMDMGQLREWRQQLAAGWTEGSRAFMAAHAAAFKAFPAAMERLQATATALTGLLEVNLDTLYADSPDRTEALANAASRWQLHMEQWKDWCNWMEVKQRAVDAGLRPLVTAWEHNSITASAITLQFQRDFYRAAAEYIIAQQPQLASFNSSLFEDKIRKFREMSRRFEQLTREELYARLAARVPNFTLEASQSSEIGMLQRALRNNGRALSIRKLFDAIPNLLPRLSPCMLMSPISVAQYFDAERVQFDLVIFDEASQMPTCEAVGAIARGANVIVVGDPKQMPPTSFFSTNNVDEDNLEKEDLESILDDCLSLSMPSQHLLWHYRSKHESLIAFSNAKYYDNKLLTFPSTDDISSKVQLVHVDGFYDKGKTRQNQEEAKAIVAEVVRRLSDPQLIKRSMGIVTFSSVQQILIEDLLTEAFATRPELEKRAMECEEPLFIKNLENVQGDERDVILFSVGYGPDQDGKVSLNFGPINRDGGWRRLNVAITRARYEMTLFSTLRSDQIDLNRTSSEGVAGLKAFLAYAEKGTAVLPAARQQQTETASFENTVANAIKAHGYEVHTHIGTSSYKIDIAVVDPKDPARYLLAILTDGKHYYQAATCKDREIVQPDVLKMLGWNLYKIWSTAWWEDSGKVLQGILQALEAAQAQKPAPPVIAEPAPLPETPEAPVRDEAINSMQPAPVAKSVVAGVAYELCSISPVAASADEFVLQQHKERIKAQIIRVLETESPVSVSLLSKRVLAAWGIARMGNRITGHFEQLFKEIGLQARGDGKTAFFWKPGHSADTYIHYRTPASELHKRDAEDLPPEEIANAIRAILQHQISLPQAELIKELARLFGFSRTGTNVENAMLAGIAAATRKGIVRRVGERVVYAG
jgi:very-short-patch-repair endonuclease